MIRPFLSFTPRREVVDLVLPRRTFADVILPESTRRALEEALVQIDKHHLIFEEWGLGERHSTGVALAFHFAGPPGTGKTICAEAVAHAIGKRLLRVRYSEMESAFVGESGKNVAAAFRQAREHDAVLFFDEADSIAGRRFAQLSQGYEREANLTVNVLLSELEHYPGVVIFATNLAANFDPAFERRVRTHILFELPEAAEREKIWRAQIHPEKTPLASDVDFRGLAAGWEVSGGDIKNAVLKAAQAAAAEKGRDRGKAIAQRHFVSGIESVVAGKKTMKQSLFEPSPTGAPRRLDSVEAAIEDLRGALDGRQSAAGSGRPRFTAFVIVLSLAAGAAVGWMIAAMHLFR
ncbi:MAG TPA: AAA family ATPase [Thermoanaerobaculia bacterium]|nr:AAA family ATPase [Thermoanaerobaculia bacterium]